jgi:hypothetical protein
VKLLRSGGGYLEGQAQHYSTRHLWIVVIGMLAALIVGVIWHPALSIVPLLIAARLAMPAYKKLTHFRSGIAGEQDVTRLLAKLPDEYVVVNDVMLPIMLCSGHAASW